MFESPVKTLLSLSIHALCEEWVSNLKVEKYDKLEDINRSNKKSLL